MAVFKFRIPKDVEELLWMASAPDKSAEYKDYLLEQSSRFKWTDKKYDKFINVLFGDDHIEFDDEFVLKVM